VHLAHSIENESNQQIEGIIMLTNVAFRNTGVHVWLLVADYFFDKTIDFEKIPDTVKKDPVAKMCCF
jgi:hypothetical protein